jgi:hypothetical protein
MIASSPLVADEKPGFARARSSNKERPVEANVALSADGDIVELVRRTPRSQART